MTKRKKKAVILKPHHVGKCKYMWDALTVGTSKEKAAGFGVFATKTLAAGTMIPIVGKRLSRSRIDQMEKLSQLTHAWVDTDLQPVDGHPRYNPHLGVGSFGLAIAMLVNEPCHKKTQLRLQERLFDRSKDYQKWRRTSCLLW